VPDEGDYYWNFSGDLRNPQWCASATAILQSRAAQDLLGDPAAQYYSIQSINACVVYKTPQERSYEVPSTLDLEASYKQLPLDLEVDARHGRLAGTVRQAPPFNRAMLHASSRSHIRRHTLCVHSWQAFVLESATQCAVVLKLLESGQLCTKWDFQQDYNTLCAAVEGMPPPPGLDASFARVVVLCARARIACTAHVLLVP